MSRRSRVLMILAAAALPLWASASAVSAADLGLSGGDWNLSLDAGDLTAGAGSDLPPSIASGSSHTVLDVTGAVGGWEIQVSRSDDAWPSGVGLQVRRTTDGTGPGDIGGGATWTTVDPMWSTLCTGSGDRTGIRVQLRVTGTSIHVAPQLYLTTVTFLAVNR